MITLLATVKVPKVVVILAAASNAATLLGILVTTVTSGNDSTHMPGSKHYTDEALDFRTKDIPDQATRVLWCERTQARLGPDYQAILEADHLHVEYDPKKGS